MKKLETTFKVIRLPIDILAATGALLLAYFIRPITDLIPGVQFQFVPGLLPPLQSYLQFTAIAAIGLIGLFIMDGSYILKKRRSWWNEAGRVIFLVSAWMLFIVAYYSLVAHSLFFSRIALAHIWLFTIVFITAGRSLIRFLHWSLLRWGIGRRKILFIGVSPLADRYFHKLAVNPEYEIIGALADKKESRRQGDLQIIGLLDEFERIIQKYGAEEIIVAEGAVNESVASGFLEYCRCLQIQYHFIPDLLRLQKTHVDLEMIDGLPLISLKQTPLEGWRQVLKRLFDILVSGLLIVLLLPVWIVLALAVKWSSKGPIIYKSKRVGKDGLFTVYKFRSMVADADRRKNELLKQNERSGPLFKIKNDPRITKIGRFLRKTSLDELPQLFNVLWGQISLVGPRPHLPEEVAKYAQHHRQVFTLKPGITGLAQINGRSNLSFEEEVRLDVYYIENWSLILDVQILLKTLFVVLKADGH